jgi:hypothetical protein
VNKPKAIGTAAETAVARYLAVSGFPHAERRALRGTLDAGDITGTPGICWEVKGGEAAKTASDLLVSNWLYETADEAGNAGADVGVLVMQRRGIGPANAGRWWAAFLMPDLVALLGGAPWPGDRLPEVRMSLQSAVLILRTAGYGQPLTAEVSE